MKNIQFNRVSPKPNTEHRTPNTEHYRFRSINTGLLLFVQVVWLSLSTAIPSTAQCPVASVLSMDPTFVSLRICDIAFPINILFFNDSGTDHDYFIEIYSPFELRLEPPVAGLSNFQETISPSGDNVVYTGTFNVPLFYPGGNAATLSLPFSRLGTWSGKEFILVTVYDADCPGTPVLLSQSVLIDFAEPHTDLRAFPETKISELLNLGVIPSPCSPPTTPQFLIDDVLDFNLPYCITGGIGAPHRLVLLPGARIDISSSVIFDLVEVSTCPGSTLGEGIRVKPYGSLDVISSSIEDCRIGINAEPESFLSVSNTFFQNNYVGLNLDMRDAPLAGTKRLYALSLSGNTFTAALDGTPLKAPYPGMPEAVETRGYAGIRLYDYMDFNVWQRNTFNRLANGLVAFNSTLNIGDFQFDDMNSVGALAYESEGYGIHLRSKGGASWANINEPWLPAMTFNNCKTGIRANAYAGRIENCTMTNVNTGIWWENSRNRDVRIFGDTITARHFGIRSGLNEPLHPISAIAGNVVTITDALAPENNQTRGIEMNEIGFGGTSPGGTSPAGLEGWDVDGNSVTMQQGGIGIAYRNGFLGTVSKNSVVNAVQPNEYTGILAEGVMFSDLTANTVSQTAAGLGTSTAIHSSAGFANTYQCNCVDNTDIGLNFLDMSEFTDAVRGNSMNSHCTGLQLNAGAYIGEQNHTGNLWDLGAITGNCLGGRNFSIPTLSRFFVNGTANPALNPPVWPDVIWFKDEPGTTFSGCAACTFPPLTPPRLPESSVPTRLDVAIATDSLSPELFENETNWKGAFRLYRKMLRHPSIESYATEFADFKAVHDSLSTGRLAYIAEERSKIFSYGAVQDSLLEVYRLTWHEGMTELLTLDSLRQSGDTSTLVAQYDSAVALSTAAREQYASYLDTLGMARRAKIQSLLTQNAAISTAITPADNHKTVNAIVFGLLLNDSLQTGDLATLEAIAETCPLEGGDAVYEARAIVAHMTGASFDDAELCAVSEERKRAEPAETPVNAGKIVLCPNPTTGLLTWSGTNEQPVLLRLYSSTGQLQMEQNLTGTMVQIGHLPEGLYQVQLLDAEGQIPFGHTKSIVDQALNFLTLPACVFPDDTQAGLIFFYYYEMENSSAADFISIDVSFKSPTRR